eukprot:gnl/MRDRNA2_/MRDRNA2_71434_c0_seq1.p1 gnl/MRDRNA2_/MRDRNA2_71434_c0~~gnl/MRDRNA2_/MRDRNA2_71434_c0_seq1.p1  ORF type:complete len:510 (-),score=66.90 gnl/MRDRNA2_/MRDRNA2_71434_c0_seq1:430-1959(-)
MHHAEEETRYSAVRTLLSLVVLILVSGLIYEKLDLIRMVFFTAPFWMMMLLHRFRVTISTASFAVLALIIFEMFLIRGYAVRCRHLWRQQAAAELWKTELQSNSLVSDPGTTPPPIPQEEVTNVELRDYCAMPHPYPQYMVMGSAEKVDTSEKFVLTRAHCYNWTCTFTEQHEGLGTKLLFVIIMAAFLNMVYVNPKILCGDCCNLLIQCTGAGKCRSWLIWFWVLVTPFFIILYVTWEPNFNYSNLLALGIHLGSVLIKNLERCVVIFTSMLVLFIGYHERRRIARLLDIDDRNFFRFDFRDIYDPQWRTRDLKMFQVCLWKVTAWPPDDVKDIAEGRSRKPSHTTSFFSKLTSSIIPAQSTEVQHLLNKDEQYLPGVGGSMKDLFVRISLGDEEPFATRILYAQQLNPDTAIIFQETFRVNYSDKYNLNVSLRDQDVVGSKEIARKSFDPEDLLQKITGNENRIKHVTKMLDAPDDDDKEMFEAGFVPYKLSEGGAVWLAFSWLKNA